MKGHFDTAWSYVDTNQDGDVGFDQVHVFQRSLMGRLNNFAMASGTIGDTTGGSLDDGTMDGM